MADRTNRNVGGVILLVLGVLFLFQTFDILDFGPLFSNWWPIILVIVAVFKLRGTDKRRGAVLFVVGVVLLSATLNIINWGTIFRLWPVVLILMGLSMLTQRREFWRRLPGSDEAADDVVSSQVIFGGLNRTVLSKNLRGGDIAAVFGGIEIDFRQAQLADELVVINLTALFGGINVQVPSGWKVAVTGTPILGGIEDKTSAQPDGADVQIEFRCTAVFGGVEVRD